MFPRSAVNTSEVFSQKNVLQRTLLALVGLGIGCMTYLVYRQPIHPIIATLQEAASIDWSTNSAPFVGSLPTVCHTFAFVLLTSVFLSDSNLSYILNFLFWFTLESIFEVLQIAARPPYQFMHQLVDMKNMNDWFEAYFYFGTYDPVDVAAALIGGVIALVYLLTTGRRAR